MSDVPERIWATEDAENYGEDRFHSTSPFRGGSEYLRLDLHLAALAERDARIAALEAGLEQLHKTATKVSHLGAVTGSHWTPMTIALLRARALMDGGE